MSGVTSSYIVDRNPYKFGGKQNDWNAQSRSAITDAAAQMKAAREGEFDGKALFHRILETFEGIRGKIAQQHGTKDAERFGRRRDFPGSMSFYFTELDQAYSAYNTALLAKWSIILKAMEAAGTTVHEKDYGLSHIKVEKLEPADLKKRVGRAHLVLGIFLCISRDLLESSTRMRKLRSMSTQKNIKGNIPKIFKRSKCSE